MIHGDSVHSYLKQKFQETILNLTHQINSDIFFSILLDMTQKIDLMTHSSVSVCSLKITILENGHIKENWVLIIRAVR